MKGGVITYRTIGRVMMISLGSRKPAALYEHITTRIQWNPAWKQCFEIFMNGGFKDVYVSQALLSALEDTFRANWRIANYMSPHSFVYLLESLYFITSFYSRIFFTTKSSFVGWFTHVHSITIYSASQQIVSNATHFIVRLIQQILYNKSDTKSWIQSSGITFSNYHRLLSLKLVMMLALICLQVSDCSQVLLDLLFGNNNVAYLLPREFVTCLLKRRKGRYLNMHPEVVAEAFMSVNDSLLIVCTGNANPRIHAPGALFVDLRKSKEEIMGVLFPRKTVPSNDDDTVVIPEAQSLSTSLDDNLNVNPVELQFNWKVLEEISKAINEKRDVTLNTLPAAPMMKKELDKNINILATALADKQFCAGKDESVVHEAMDANTHLELLSSAFGTRLYLTLFQTIMEHSDFMKMVQGLVENVQCLRPKIDGFLNDSVTSQESKIEQMVVSETTEVGRTSEEKNNAKGTGAVVENQTGGGHTQGAKNNKGKNNAKGTDAVVENQTVGGNTQGAKNNKGKNNVKGNGAVVENQTVGGNTQDAKGKKGKKKNKKNKGKK
ncbi:uncharacterized protein LOC143565610 [Bidens hawaiensis]|uniref:uncharacterized protein LOC143565610 n=1 Tax=Bidens hawaiensis TaxID=980011 RepID=UPI004049B042